ncbi:lysophosphatidylserine lipase ABHD12-like [Ptychodera flava]|uniref:lysophosphatidylserine lipase ABHD12-like n=1 Tax=Ptychodera flava TaxID=63121 RepID=UPI003969E064
MRHRGSQKTGETTEEKPTAQPASAEEKTNHCRRRSSPQLLLRLLWLIVKCAIILVLAGYIAFPIVLNTIPFVPRELIFLSKVRWPYYVEFDHPEWYNISGGRNVRVKSTDNVTLGVWQILPKSLAEDGQEKTIQYFERALSDNKPVVLYFHGNSGNRARDHRIELYNTLAELNYHVIAFDYREYGDSTGMADGAGVLQDALVMAKWLRPKIGSSKFVLYGHSLGTAVATALARKLCEKDECPNALILESPLSDVKEAASSHPLAKFWKFWPYFDKLFLDAFEETSVHFNSTENIDHVSSKILIGHAKDDVIIPFSLGEKLATHAKNNRPEGAGELMFFAFQHERGFGHKFICRAPEWPNLIEKFVETSREHDVKPKK